MNKFIIFAFLFIIVFSQDNDYDDESDINFDDLSSFGEEYFYIKEEGTSCLKLNVNNNLTVEKCNSVEISDEKYKCCLQTVKEIM